MLKSSAPPLPSVTIGISAYNEQDTIGNLLQDLSAQVQNKFTIKKIFVISDGSSDNTVAVARASKVENLQVLVDHKRKGLAERLNELCQKSSTDILIILNADIRITDPLCFAKVVKPIIEKQADLTSCDQIPLAGRNWLEKTLAESMILKNNTFAKINNGNTVYTCHGTIRGMSKKLYTKLHFPHSVGEDGYSYLFAKANKFKYMYVTGTNIWYSEPNVFADYKKQVQRFQQSQQQFAPHFGIEFIEEAYKVPAWPVFSSLLVGFLRKPLLLINYFIILILVRINVKPVAKVSTTWDIAQSSKRTST